MILWTVTGGEGTLSIDLQNFWAVITAEILFDKRLGGLYLWPLLSVVGGLQILVKSESVLRWDDFFCAFASVWEVCFQVCARANFKEKIHIIYISCLVGFSLSGDVCGFFGFGLVFFLVLFFFFLILASLFPPTFVCKKGFSTVIGLGVELIHQNFFAAVVSLAIPFVQAGWKCDYIGNKLLKCFPPSLSLASSRTACPCS